jgi:hypothetical protein
VLNLKFATVLDRTPSELGGDMERIIGAIIFAMGLAVGFMTAKTVYDRPVVERPLGTTQGTSNPGEAINPEKK